MQRRRVMLIVETSLVYGREVLRGINRYVVANEPWSIYVDLRELVVRPPAWLEKWEGDGIITRSTTPSLAEKLRALKIPTVDLTDIYGSQGLPQIGTNHEAVGKMGAQHLLERGFRHFAFCGFTGHNWSSRRQEGFKTVVTKAGFDFHQYQSPWDTTTALTWDEQQSQIVRWLESLPRPAGIMACNDMRGQHVLDACRRIGVAVPEEIAVIGVDNDELVCDLCDPPLSSIMPNPQRIGYEAASMLDALMRGEKPKQMNKLIEPIGVVTRQSTDVLAIDDPLVASAVKYIRQHACDGISVEEVLKQVPVSRSILERRFRKYIGRSPQSEIRAVQLKRVRQLLRETDLPLERIATLAGYDHPEYMSVVFKRELGQTPGQYRTQNVKGASRRFR
ncbi:AraC family transcriptional regulator [Blastopirellula marina]|uniref:Xylose operon regulatory protein n=1 Tax=Blastopirellula marina DSM 3645 TaxID=314230 RepID=A4A1D2_9BACT|nr:DNA-binding transcriptional regulator [Blastopirellula marina]EAQ77381.1 xylose operon regulatory protein [Blastopirellula marina DSM 3645]